MGFNRFGCSPVSAHGPPSGKDSAIGVGLCYRSSAYYNTAYFPYPCQNHYPKAHIILANAY